MKEHTNELNNIKLWLYQGAISYDQAKKMADPHLAALNARAAELAKKYGQRPRRITFAAFMR